MVVPTRRLKIDVLEHALEGGVVGLECGECPVQTVTNLVVDAVAEMFPASLRRDKERTLVVVRVIGSSLGVLPATTLGELVGDDLLAFDIEHVAGTLQEQRSEDVLLELGGVHLPAEDVGGGEEVSFQLGKCEHGSENRGSSVPDECLVASSLASSRRRRWLGRPQNPLDYCGAEGFEPLTPACKAGALTN